MSPLSLWCRYGRDIVVIVVVVVIPFRLLTAAEEMYQMIMSVSNCVVAQMLM